MKELRFRGMTIADRFGCHSFFNWFQAFLISHLLIVLIFINSSLVYAILKGAVLVPFLFINYKKGFGDALKCSTTNMIKLISNGGSSKICAHTVIIFSLPELV